MYPKFEPEYQELKLRLFYLIFCQFITRIWYTFEDRLTIYNELKTYILKKENL